MIFAAQNSHDTTVRFLFVDATPRVVILIVVSALMGFAAGLIVGRPVGRRKKHEKKRRRK